jgi:hypothetical protein
MCQVPLEVQLVFCRPNYVALWHVPGASRGTLVFCRPDDVALWHVPPEVH